MTGTIIGVVIVALALGILAWKIYGSVTGKSKVSGCGCSGCSGCSYAGSCDSFAPDSMTEADPDPSRSPITKASPEPKSKSTSKEV